jgi:hypothetical protein
MYPISLAEWIAVADTEPRMMRYRQDETRPGYAYIAADGRGWAVSWRDGLLTISKGEPDAGLVAIADRLGARLVGDDSEEYHADGTFTHWSEPRPILFSRPLNVDEAATAWRLIFERQGDDRLYFGRPTPGHAWYAFAAFRSFAEREVAAADVPDADGLLYQYGPFGSGDDPVFRLSFVRQLATDADGDLTRVECCLDFAMIADLAALGSFGRWWFPKHRQPRDEWFDALAARSEWQRLDALMPRTLTFTPDPGRTPPA